MAGKNILLITHELSMTGAPIALYYAAKSYIKNGDYAVMLSPEDGPLRKEIVEDGISLIVDTTINGSDFWLKTACNFDLVIVCTLSEYQVIPKLEQLGIPVLWWVHESERSYILGADAVIPHEISSDIHVYCGGHYAQKMLHKFRPSYSSDILLYGVEEYQFSEDLKQYCYELKNIENKIIFFSVGTFEFRKGQDLLVKAIEELPKEYLQKVKFIFAGKSVDDEIYQAVYELYKKYPDFIEMIEFLTRKELMDVYRQVDCVICSSRDDPMPVFMTEALMLSKICICSENTGTASLLQDGINGFVFKDNDYEQLKEKIIEVIEQYDQLDKMKLEGRKVYEKYFSVNIFHKNLMEITNSILKKD